MRPISESSRMLVGALLDAPDPKRLLQAAQLSPEALGDKFLGVCWDLIGKLAHEGGRVTAATLFAHGTARKLLGEDDLGLLLEMQGRSHLDERAFVQVASEVRRVAGRQLLGRMLVELGNNMLKDGDESRTQQRFTAIGQAYSRLHANARRGSAVVLSAFEEYENRKRDGRPPLVPTGLEALDKQTGGLPPKLTCFVGPPGTFKSGLMAAILERQLQAGLRPLVVSLEDRDTWVVKRYMAKRLGMKVRDVFAKDFPDEAKAQEEAQALSTLMHNSWFVTKQHVRTSQDICRTIVQLLAQENITNAWIDNARAVKGPEVDPRARWQPDRRLIASAMYEDFAECADRYGIPIGLLAHTSRKYFDRTQGKGPPIMSDIGETGDAEKDVRLMLALWKKSGKLRISIGKHTEGEHDHDSPPTLEFDHLGETALVDPDTGVVIDLKAEERSDREEQKYRMDHANVSRQLRRKKLKTTLEAQEKPPPEPPKPEAQQTLLAVPSTTKPEAP